MSYPKILFCRETNEIWHLVSNVVGQSSVEYLDNFTLKKYGVGQTIAIGKYAFYYNMEEQGFRLPTEIEKILYE